MSTYPQIVSTLSVGKLTNSYPVDVNGTVNCTQLFASSNITIQGQTITGLGNPSMASYTTAGTYTWTPPTGVAQITVEIVGGGGGGGGGGATVQEAGGGGGGGAGAYTKAVINVSSSNTYTIVVGAGGAGGTSTSGATNTNGSNGSNGSNSTFGLSSTLLITANGGSGGLKPYYNQPNPVDTGANDAWAAGWGGIGGAVSSITDTSNVTVSILQSAGGSGDDASTNTGRNFEVGGTGGSSYFGSGGRGQNDEINAVSPGLAIGSGGGGGCSQFPINGGAGASGAVIITYLSANGLPPVYTATAPLAMAGTALTLNVGTGLSVSGGSLCSAAQYYTAGTWSLIPGSNTSTMYRNNYCYQDSSVYANGVTLPTNTKIKISIYGCMDWSIAGFLFDFYNSKTSTWLSAGTSTNYAGQRSFATTVNNQTSFFNNAIDYNATNQLVFGLYTDGGGSSPYNTTYEMTLEFFNPSPSQNIPIIPMTVKCSGDNANTYAAAYFVSMNFQNNTSYASISNFRVVPAYLNSTAPSVLTMTYKVEAN